MTLALGIVAGVLLARFLIDRKARRQHWRVGRYGILLCTFRRKRGGCLRCGTDWRWGEPHDTPLRAEDGYCVFPLCQSCWLELPKAGRLPFYAKLLDQWAETGQIQKGSNRWDDVRVAIWAAVEAGL